LALLLLLQAQEALRQNDRVIVKHGADHSFIKNRQRARERPKKLDGVQTHTNVT